MKYQVWINVPMGEGNYGSNWKSLPSVFDYKDIAIHGAKQLEARGFHVSVMELKDTGTVVYGCSGEIKCGACPHPFHTKESQTEQAKNALDCMDQRNLDAYWPDGRVKR